MLRIPYAPAAGASGEYDRAGRTRAPVGHRRPRFPARGVHRQGAVCLALGVSRFPVSEALARLATEGLVEILPQRGTRAARIRLPEIRNRC
ncbi:GntR family transcriptional regulator [Microvirga arabica]|uniref:GntR family transcriptional regulator n=1 Tax=Microvirga arabica TaxID=1128671 RepID=UPI00360CCF05